MKYFAKLTLLIGLLALLVACATPSTESAAASSATSADTSTTEQTNTDATASEQTSADQESLVSNTETSESQEDEDVERPAGWSEETHSNDADPNYDVVFPDDEVNQMTITIDPEDWAAMQVDLAELMSSRDSSENPMWVAATIEFEGDVWTNVGVRYKGNSSLNNAWSSGSDKLPFKLDFDEFEDEYPEIDNQRFYGFKQLSLANSYNDDTFMRDALAYDLLEEAGLVSAETAPYELIVDYGEGPVSLGLYTMVEVIDDTVIDEAFGDDDGNIYEGDGTGVTLALGTKELIAESFEKENNEDEADWSDIEALYDVLHSETRTSDPEAWRSELEAIFDVDTFLEWLAVAAVIEHWDTYGSMTHNFYLYNDPETGQLTWISWDHNETFGSSGGGGGDRAAGQGGQAPADFGDRVAPPEGAAPPDGAAPADGAGRPEGGGRAAGGPGGGFGGGGGGGRSTSLDKADVSDQWPLIRFLLDDEVYYEQYMDYLESSAELINPDSMNARIEAMAAVVDAAASDDIGADAFNSAVASLMQSVATQYEEVSSFLAQQP